MTVEPLAALLSGGFTLLMVVWVAAAIYPRARTPGMPPMKVGITDKQKVLDELALRDEWMDNEIKIRRGLVEKAKKYDFRDDAPEIMQMLKRKYKNKDSIRKAKNVVDHIYQMYENRCKKCTK